MSLLAPLLNTILTWFLGLGITQQLLAIGSFRLGGYYFGLMLVSKAIA